MLTFLGVMVVRIGAWVMRHVTLSFCLKMGRLLGLVWFYLLPIRRKTVVTQMIRALPERTEKDCQRLAREMYLHWGQCFSELLRYGGPHGLPSPKIQLAGEQYAHQALALGRGLLILTAHIGNFELSLRAAQPFGLPLTVIMKTMHLQAAEAIWRELRRGPGDASVCFRPTQGSARAVLKDLAEGGLVAYVFDQHAAGPHAVDVDFFGQPAETSTDLARLQRLSGAPILPAFGYRDADGGHHVELGSPIESDGASIEEITARCTALIESAVRAHPEQWMWLHRRWKHSKKAK